MAIDLDKKEQRITLALKSPCGIYACIGWMHDREQQSTEVIEYNNEKMIKLFIKCIRRIICLLPFTFIRINTTFIFSLFRNVYSCFVSAGARGSQKGEYLANESRF